MSYTRPAVASQLKCFERATPFDAHAAANASSSISRSIAAAIEDGAYRPRPTIGFVDWADRWLASLERKPSTIGSYRSTIAHAKETFGSQRVRRIGAEDIG